MFNKLLLASVLSLFCALAAAQEANNGVTRYLVTTDHVKPEQLALWRTLQQTQVMPALKKAGVKTRRVYHTMIGDTTEYVSYELFPDYVAFDGPDALERALGKAKADDLKKRLGDCLNSSQTRLENSQNDMYADPGDAPALLSSSYRANEGKSAAYMNFLRTELWPPVKKAVEVNYVKGFQLMITSHGGEEGIYVMNMFYPSFKALEGPTPAAYILQKEGTLPAFFQKGAGLIQRLGVIIRGYENELSY